MLLLVAAFSSFSRMYNIPLCVCVCVFIHVFFLHSSTGGYLGCFRDLTEMNMRVQASFPDGDFISFGYIPSSGVAVHNICNVYVTPNHL